MALCKEEEVAYFKLALKTLALCTIKGRFNLFNIHRITLLAKSNHFLKVLLSITKFLIVLKAFLNKITMPPLVGKTNHQQMEMVSTTCL